MDLYQLLGLTRVASLAEIERAYRRLARRYHPGLNPGDRVAADMYEQIQTAYAVLTDVEQRQAYDRGNGVVGTDRGETVRVAFQGFDFSAPAEGPLAATFSELFADVFQEAAREATTPTRGADLELIVRLSFDEAVVGGAVPVSVVREERCVTCRGDGHVRRAPVMCPICQGSGIRRWARGHMVFSGTCEACDGQGRVTAQRCAACNGIGTMPRSEVVTLTLPAGIEPGARLSVPGRGHAGARGGPAGDLYVSIDVAEHAVFRRAGRDLRLTLPVAVHEAALGADVDVPTLDAEPARIAIPPGTSSGTELRVRGRGIADPLGDPAGAGDLVVEVQIVMPVVTDERSKALLREFGQIHDADVRKHLFTRDRAGV